MNGLPKLDDLKKKNKADVLAQLKRERDANAMMQRRVQVEAEKMLAQNQTQFMKLVERMKDIDHKWKMMNFRFNIYKGIIDGEVLPKGSSTTEILAKTEEVLTELVGDYNIEWNKLKADSQAKIDEMEADLERKRSENMGEAKTVPMQPVAEA